MKTVKSVHGSLHVSEFRFLRVLDGSLRGKNKSSLSVLVRPEPGALPS